MSSGPLTVKEKAGFLMLLVFAILVVILGFKNFDNTIKAPFAKQLSAAPTPGEPTEEEINQQLKNKDTDQDGLNDYDELNLYLTSPYLADSDSDNFPDGAEIKNSTDPNCPQGKNCGPSFEGQKIKEPAKQGAPSLPPSLGGLWNVLSTSGSDPKILRQFLTEQGVDAKLLERVSDQELLSLLREEEPGAARPHPNPLPAAGEGTPLLPLPQGEVGVRGFSAAEWRQELLSQGFDPEVLKKLSDEDLQKTVLEVLKETKQ